MSSLRQHPSSQCVCLSLNVPSAQLHSHYLLIILDTAATGSAITKRAECKSVTFVLTLFVGFFFIFFFSTGWWHVKCSPGGRGNLEQYGNWVADGYFCSHQMCFCPFMSCWWLNYNKCLIGNFRSRSLQLMNNKNQLYDHWSSLFTSRIIN